MPTRDQDALKVVLKRFTQKNSGSKDAARAALIKEGIYTKTGDIAAEYGGADFRKVAKKAR